MIYPSRPDARPNLNPTLQFMNQLFSNKNDYAKGRNMPVHYMSEKLHLVRTPASCLGGLLLTYYQASNILSTCNTNTSW